MCHNIHVSCNSFWTYSGEVIISSVITDIELFLSPSLPVSRSNFLSINGVRVVSIRLLSWRTKSYLVKKKVWGFYQTQIQDHLSYNANHLKKLKASSLSRVHSWFFTTRSVTCNILLWYNINSLSSTRSGLNSHCPPLKENSSVCLGGGHQVITSGRAREGFKRPGSQFLVK